MSKMRHRWEVPSLYQAEQSINPVRWGPRLSRFWVAGTSGSYHSPKRTRDILQFACLSLLFLTVLAVPVLCAEFSEAWISELLRSRWVTDELQALQEPPIGSYPAKGAFYRFLWLRAFDRCVTVTIERDADHAVLKLKALDKPWTSLPGNTSPGNLEINREVTLTLEQWYQVNSLSFRGFWTGASREVTGSVDGSVWILEGFNGEDDRRVVVQENPGSIPENPFRQFCLKLLELSTLDLGRERVY